MSDIVVSVVISVYNGRDYISRAVRSALDQTLPGIEVIVVDDASTDGTAVIVAEFASAESRIRLISSRENRGPSASRNSGIAAARGRWISILDADDWYAPHRLKGLISAGEAAHADLVSDDLVLFDDRANAIIGPMFEPRRIPKLITAPLFVAGNMPDPAHPRQGYGFLKPVIRRSFLADNALSYREIMRFSEDYAFYLEALQAGASWVTVSQATYFYAVRDSSLTAKHRADDLFRLCAVDEEAIARAEHDEALLRALRLHLVSTQKRASWARFIDQFKERDFRASLQTTAMNPAVFTHVASQCLIQASLRSCHAVSAAGRSLLPFFTRRS